VLIRAARADDAPALVPVFAAWGHPQPAPVIAERLAAWEATPAARVLVAEVAGTAAGVAAVAVTPHFARPGRFARLIGLAVGEPYRRRGIATALLDAAEAYARAQGCDRLELTSTRTRAEAPPFYAARGYADLSERQARYARTL
jgi:GNAT superfamily N-acetyltransferase